jgi:hypothetical protein
MRRGATARQRRRLRVSATKGERTHVVHAREDAIAPIDEGRRLAAIADLRHRDQSGMIE